MSYSQDNVTHANESERLIGRVKWFNNKAGYGFITVTDGPRSGTDVFVHYSSVYVVYQSNNQDSDQVKYKYLVPSQYKYLVQGEYVEFDLERVESDKHEWQASNVSGIKGGKLMCQTRHENKLARHEHVAALHNNEEEYKPVRTHRQRRHVERDNSDAQRQPSRREPRTEQRHEQRREPRDNRRRH